MVRNLVLASAFALAVIAGADAAFQSPSRHGQDDYLFQQTVGEVRVIDSAVLPSDGTSADFLPAFSDTEGNVRVLDAWGLDQRSLDVRSARAFTLGTGEDVRSDSRFEETAGSVEIISQSPQLDVRSVHGFEDTVGDVSLVDSSGLEPPVTFVAQR